jgi:pimeloyl-ACP methyl ester carboxylesterase
MNKRKLVILFVLIGLILVLPLAGNRSGIALADEAEYTRIDGEIRGYPYTLIRPDNWNGDLVLLVHGSIPEFYDFRFEVLAPELASLGFGVGFTTLMDNSGQELGEPLKEVTLNTRIVQAQFTANFGQPARTYLYGFSRGAVNMIHLVETSPELYDGVFSVCGSNGGPQMAWDYFLHARVLFDYYFPGVLPGEPLDTPYRSLDGFFETVPLMVQAILANPAAAIDMAAVYQFDLQYNDFPELLNGIIESQAIPITTINILIENIGGNPFDNIQTVYTGSSDDAALNIGVARFSSDRRAKNYFSTWGEPSGRLGSTPFLALHTSRDSIVPERLNNDNYQTLVEGSGYGEFFLRRVIDRRGHCTIDNAELAEHFADLVSWVETGVRPNP